MSAINRAVSSLLLNHTCYYSCCTIHRAHRLAFIKSLHPAPTDPKTLDDLHNFWLGHYGLKLPTKNFPFLVGVASHPEAESASLEVPSCCVMTNLGLSVLPGSMPGGSCYSEAVGLLLENLKSSELQLLGGEGFKVETNTGRCLCKACMSAQFFIRLL